MQLSHEEKVCLTSLTVFATLFAVLVAVCTVLPAELRALLAALSAAAAPVAWLAATEAREAAVAVACLTNNKAIQYFE